MTALKKMAAVLTAGLALGCFTTTKALAIVGGNLKEGDTSPYVSLSIVTPGDLRAPEWSFCSGTLIGNRWVVTAAHCFWDNKHDMLRFDDNTVVVVSDASGARTPYPIANITPHPLHSKRTYDYDLAIVETRLPVVGASFMPYGGLSASALKGSDTFATGWGMSSVSSSSESPASVKSVQVGIDYLYKNSIVSKHHEGKGSVCYGDSGGSLTATDPRFPESLLIGVISLMVHDYAPATSGDLCNLRNSFISTNLGHLSQWIQSVTGIAPRRTQDTLSETICSKAWLQKNSVSNKQIALTARTANLSKAGMTPNLVVPVSLGGVNNISNVGLVSKTGKYSVATKKLFEKWLHGQVCQQRMPLTKAQSLVIDWTANFDIYYQKN